MLRVEWAKARARVLRYQEELQLLSEEMRRSIAYCNHEALSWLNKAEQLINMQMPPAMVEALTAYALERARQEQALSTQWDSKWEAVRKRASQVLESAESTNHEADAADADIDSDDEPEDHSDDIVVQLDLQGDDDDDDDDDDQ